MSLFGDIVGSLLGGSAQQPGEAGAGSVGMPGGLPGGVPGGMPGSVPGALVGLLSQPGALSGLIEHFDQAGLGDTVRSWISNEAGNQPVDPADLHAALGPEIVQQLAAHTGLPVGEVLQQFAAHLPAVVDAMTPAGEVPGHATLADIGLGLLRDRFGGAAAPATDDDAG